MFTLLCILITLSEATRQSNISTLICPFSCTGEQVCICKTATDCSCQTVCPQAENKEIYRDQNNNIISVCPIGQEKCLNCCPNLWTEGCESCCSDKSEGIMRSEMSGIWLGISLGIMVVIAIAIACCFLVCICFTSLTKRRSRDTSFATFDPGHAPVRGPP